MDAAVKIVSVASAIAAVLFAPGAVAAQVPASNPTTSVRLTLDAAVMEALDKNLDLIGKRAGVTIAEANLVTARLRPNPVLSLGGDHLDILGTGFDDVNGAGPPEYIARLDFLFERGSKRARRFEVGQEDRAIAEGDVLDAIRGDR
jgi:cobalt-zinc-cadmium efflux system outer membrane protein